MLLFIDAQHLATHDFSFFVVSVESRREREKKTKHLPIHCLRLHVRFAVMSQKTSNGISETLFQTHNLFNAITADETETESKSL